MLKVEIPIKAPSIWDTINSLRIHDMDHLAPVFRARIEAMMPDTKKISTVNGELFDPIVFETARVDALQRIYYEQGSTNAPSALYGWHFYGLAADWISKSKEWSVRQSWWKLLAQYMRKYRIDPGLDWVHPDDPHGQFGGLKKSPSDRARMLYFGTNNWAGMTPFTDPAEHRAGLERVWRAVGAM
jgi:hypothetical protein